VTEVQADRQPTFFGACGLRDDFFRLPMASYYLKISFSLGVGSLRGAAGRQDGE
jgi:hypothetical protein